MATHDTTEHGAPGEHAGLHLPDPSIWPLVVGLAFGLVGGALIWWQRDTSSDIALVAMGAAGAFALLAGCGWAYEDGRMRAKAEDGGGHGPRAPRYNQLVTFGVPEGAFAASTLPNGVLGEIEAAAAALHDLDGFQDMRMTVSPAETGPSQVVVETTWSGREQLASYNETRQSMLDILARHDEQVAPGSVQVFDMEVLRDTKDTSFRFGWAGAATILGSLAILGFMLGAGLTLFEEEGEATGGEAPPANGGNEAYSITATDNAFDKSTLQAPPETEVTFTLHNDGKTKHNLAFYQSQGGAEIAVGEILDGGADEEITFTTPGEGDYYFQCDLHPDQMKGTFEVTDSAPAPGGGAASGGGDGGSAGGSTVTATDNKFSQATINATAGQAFTISLKNDGKSIHNISFYDKQGGKLLDPAAEGDPVRAGQSGSVSFTPAQAGTFFFQCDFHPAEMTGQFVVK